MKPQEREQRSRSSSQSQERACRPPRRAPPSKTLLKNPPIARPRTPKRRPLPPGRGELREAEGTHGVGAGDTRGRWEEAVRTPLEQRGPATLGCRGGGGAGGGRAVASGSPLLAGKAGRQSLGAVEAEGVRPWRRRKVAQATRNRLAVLGSCAVAAPGRGADRGRGGRGTRRKGRGRRQLTEGDVSED